MEKTYEYPWNIRNLVGNKAFFSLVQQNLVGILLGYYRALDEDEGHRHGNTSFKGVLVDFLFPAIFRVCMFPVREMILLYLGI